MELNMLAPRTLFARAAETNNSCPWTPSLYEGATQPVVGKMTFYEFNTYLSGACAVFATLVIYAITILHGTHFSRPAEQAKIIRIGQLIPAYSLLSWFSIFVPQANYYLAPWLEVVQAICLVTFFLLMLEFIAPDDEGRQEFFAVINIKSRGRCKYDTVQKRIGFYRHKYVMLYQYPIVSLFVAILTDITLAAQVYCDISFSPRFAHLWLFLLDNVSVTAAITAVLAMYSNLKVHLKHHRPLAKLVAFKLVVGLGFLQGIIFQVLQSKNVLRPSATLTYADVRVGIPTLCTCVEMVPIALLFFYAYSYHPYCLDPKRQPVPEEKSALSAPAPVISYQGGFLGYRAYLLAADPREAFEGLSFAWRILHGGRAKENHQRLPSQDSHEPLRTEATASYDTPRNYLQTSYDRNEAYPQSYSLPQNAVNYPAPAHEHSDPYANRLALGQQAESYAERPYPYSSDNSHPQIGA